MKAADGVDRCGGSRGVSRGGPRNGMRNGMRYVPNRGLLAR
ncbi:hypothetical protein RKD29_003328 [Streptomyces tendae]